MGEFWTSHLRSLQCRFSILTVSVKGIKIVKEILEWLMLYEKHNFMNAVVMQTWRGFTKDKALI